MLETSTCGQGCFDCRQSSPSYLQPDQHLLRGAPEQQSDIIIGNSNLHQGRISNIRGPVTGTGSLYTYTVDQTPIWSTLSTPSFQSAQSSTSNSRCQLVQCLGSRVHNYASSGNDISDESQLLGYRDPRSQMLQCTPAGGSQYPHGMQPEQHTYFCGSWTPGRNIVSHSSTSVQPRAVYELAHLPIQRVGFNSSTMSEPRQGRRRQAQSAIGGNETSCSEGSKVHNSKYYCTFRNCPASFGQLQQWKRHERDTHAPRDFWICNLSQPADLNGAVCAICGFDTNGPSCPHRIPQCLRKGITQRVFGRGDHFRRHLRKQHKLANERSVVVATSSRMENKLGFRELTCFFCWKTHSDWEARSNCVAAHIAMGMTKAQWDVNVASVYG